MSVAPREMNPGKANIEITPEAAAKMQPAPETPVTSPPSKEAPAKEAPAKEAAAPAAPPKEMAAPAKQMPAPAAPAPPKMMSTVSEPQPAANAADGGALVKAKRDSDGLRLMFSFATATPAALFRRADTVWLVFDATKPLDIEPIRSNGGSIIYDVTHA